MKAVRVSSKVATPAAYLSALSGPHKDEIVALDKLIRRCVPKLEPFVHQGMLAYGRTKYKSASGREGDWFRIGVAPRKDYVSLYACAVDDRGYVAEHYKGRLGKASIGKSCVRFKRLADVDLTALEALLRETATAKALGM